MDPRQDPRNPQHPFQQRNAPAPYPHHVPFQQGPPPPQQQQQPPAFSPPQDPRAVPSVFRPDHNRRISENQYFGQPAYPRDSAPMPNAGHSRGGSTSSIGAPGPMNRNMPPPSSPQQREQQQREQQQPQPHPQPHPQPQHPPYPPPPPSRQPAPAIGPPTSFPTGRDLPALNSINRPNSVNSSMSISSMLGGSASREQLPGPLYQSPAAMMPSGAPTGPTTPFTPSIHASPRINTAGSDYDRFRRPQTPEHHRLSQSHMQQDHRATSASAGSPPRPTLTPETHRYSTPQAYPHTRNPSGSGPALGPLGGEERRDQYSGPMRVTNPNAPPPRPSSQPTMFQQAPREREPSVAETIRSDNGRSQPYVPRALGYGNRDDIPAFREQQRFEEARMRDHEREQRERNADLERKREVEIRENELMRQREMENRERQNRERERERDLRQRDAQEREREIMRERERDRMDQARNAGPFPRHEPMHQQPQQYAPRPYVSQSGPFGAREPEPWMRRPEERDPREMSLPQPPPGYQVQREIPQPYGPAPGYPPQRYAPRDPREYEPQPQHQQPQHQPHYGSPLQERDRMHGPQPMHPQQQQQQYAPQGPPGQYRPNESPRARSNEEVQNMQRGVYLGIQQEINRKGRNSPFPQAVQGAQGPPGEPGIKSEFGKMFSGIGSGVGSIAGGTASGGSLTPFQAGARREDLEGVQSLDSPTDGAKMARQNSRGGRRRKLQDDDREEDGSSTGRKTPTGRKRPKQAPQLAIGAHRHVSGTDPTTRLSSPSQPSLTPTFGQHPHGGMGPSPPRKAVPHHHHIKHHHHPHGSRHASQAPQIIMPKPKLVVKNKALLDSVAHLPQKHLGHIMYEAELTPGDPPSLEHSHGLPRRGFSSNVKPIDRDLIEGREGCRLTTRVPRIYLGDISREEITGRRALWGTEVYTDDSDIIAACIHSGWIQGAWPEEVDTSALDLVVNGAHSDHDMPNGKQLNGKPKWEKEIEDIVLEHPPKRGPMVPPRDRDMHVTVVILPALERYASTVRWGIKSREWKDSHDGLSYMIESVRFVSGVDTAAEIRGKGRRIRITAGMKEDELEREEEAGLLLALANGKGAPQNIVMSDGPQTNGGMAESFVRGDGSMKGLGMNSWWKKQEKKPEPEAVVEEIIPTPSPDAPAPTFPEPSPDQQRRSSQSQKSPEEQRQEQYLAEGVNRLYDMTRAAEHIERHHVELQPPEIEPLSSPTLQPVQDSEAQVNGQQEAEPQQQHQQHDQQQEQAQHRHVENEVDMTHAWPQLPALARPQYPRMPEPIHQTYQPSQHQPHQMHQVPQYPPVHQYQHISPPPAQQEAQAQHMERQPSQVELNEMYEHPAPPPKDGSPLENQSVEEAAVAEQRVVHEEPLIVSVPQAQITPPVVAAEPEVQEGRKLRVEGGEGLPTPVLTVPEPAAPAQVAEDMSAVEARMLSEVAPVVAEPQQITETQADKEDIAMGGMEEQPQDSEQVAGSSASQV